MIALDANEHPKTMKDAGKYLITLLMA